MKVNDNTFVVPATVSYTSDGTVSISIKIVDRDESPLRKAIEHKTVAECRSVISCYTKDNILDSHNLPKDFIWFSGIFHFVDEQLFTSPEEVAEALALKLVEHDGCCDTCSNKDKCSSAAAEHGDGWQTPDKDVCAKHIIKYFWDKCKTR